MEKLYSLFSSVLYLFPERLIKTNQAQQPTLGITDTVYIYHKDTIYRIDTVVMALPIKPRTFKKGQK